MFAQRRDAGQDWHTGAVTSVDPKGCATAAEWARRLVPAAADESPTVLETVLLTTDGRPAPTSSCTAPSPASLLHRSAGT